MRKLNYLKNKIPELKISPKESEDVRIAWVSICIWPDPHWTLKSKVKIPMLLATPNWLAWVKETDMFSPGCCSAWWFQTLHIHQNKVLAYHRKARWRMISLLKMSYYLTWQQFWYSKSFLKSSRWVKWEENEWNRIPKLRSSFQQVFKPWNIIWNNLKDSFAEWEVNGR